MRITEGQLSELEEVERNRRGLSRDGYKAEPAIAEQVYRDLVVRYGPELTRAYRELLRRDELLEAFAAACRGHP